LRPAALASDKIKIPFSFFSCIGFSREEEREKRKERDREKEREKDRKRERKNVCEGNF
jgi:hypothetical protein